MLRYAMITSRRFRLSDRCARDLDAAAYRVRPENGTASKGRVAAAPRSQWHGRTSATRLCEGILNQRTIRINPQQYEDDMLARLVALLALLLGLTLAVVDRPGSSSAQTAKSWLYLNA